MKNILKKSLHQICILSVIILAGLIFLLIYPKFMNYTPAQRLFFYDNLVNVVLSIDVCLVLWSISCNFIMETTLFSFKKSIRRGIAVVVFVLLESLSLLICFYNIPHASHFISDMYLLTWIGVFMLFSVILFIIIFILEDKFMKKDIEAINKRLNELKKEE